MRRAVRAAAGCAVHPHGRGDNEPQRVPGNAAVGSPPRAWGQCGALLRCFSICRFTPTGVGTISQNSSSVTTGAVHPHGRGDNFVKSQFSGFADGSPPRAWGQSAARCSASASRRFTPTGVGTISPARRPPPPRTVHPHGRGDNRVCIHAESFLFGSPPRAWGQLYCIFKRHFRM